MRDTLAGRGQVNYSDLTDAEVSELKGLVGSFLEGNATVDQLPCQTLKQVKETYRQMQLAYQAAAAQQVMLVSHCYILRGLYVHLATGLRSFSQHMYLTSVCICQLSRAASLDRGSRYNA